MKIRLKYVLIFVIAVLALAVYFLGRGFYEAQKTLESSENNIEELKGELKKAAEEKTALEIEADLGLGGIVLNYNKQSYFREKALEASNNIKALYVTKNIGNAGPNETGAWQVLANIKRLAEGTEINGVVIDIKDEHGVKLSANLKKLVGYLRQKNVWTIARIVSFRDSSLFEKNPEIYIKSQDGSLFSDERGYFWQDPASLVAQQYAIDAGRQAIDFGFNEIQIDYARFPAKTNGIIFPFYDGFKEKNEVIRDFYLKLRDDLRSYKPDIILSVDLFGEVSTRFWAKEIGQNLADDIDVFDYISFMLYPSHYFNGFAAGPDAKRNLPAVDFLYEDQDITKVASNNPYGVVLRAIFSASDYISSVFAKNVGNGIQPNCFDEDKSLLFCPKPKIRPWLQDFNLKDDTSRGIIYDDQKVRSQIQAAQDAGSSGWLLWNPSNVYTEAALTKE